MLFLLHPPVQGLAQWTGTGPSKAFALLSLRRLSGGDLLTIWLGQDGWEYPFQVDYETIWEAEIEAIREVADHDPRVQISIEYKPSEPRAFSLLSDLGMTLLGIKKVDRPNLGVTLDFAHVLFAGLCGRDDSAREPSSGHPPQRWVRPS
jgi:hypothetical protein